MGRPAYGVRGIDLGQRRLRRRRRGHAEGAQEDNGKGGEKTVPCLILSVTDNGYGKRTDVDEYRLQTRGGKGVINVKTMKKNGKVCAIMLVDDDIGADGHQPVRQDHPHRYQTVRAAGRSTQGVRLLNLEAGTR